MQDKTAESGPTQNPKVRDLRNPQTDEEWAALRQVLAEMEEDIEDLIDPTPAAIQDMQEIIDGIREQLKGAPKP